MTRLPLAVLALCLGGAHAEAATLRTMTTLHAPVVLLSDLFDDAGANAQRVLGPGPGAGGRIVVEAAQLGAIARQFGVDWRPASSADRAVLDRPGRPLRRDDVLDAVRTALDRRRRVGRLRRRAGGLHAAAGAVRIRSAAGGVRSRLRRQRRPVQRGALGRRRGDGTDPYACHRPGGRHGGIAGRHHAAARRQRAARRGRAHGARAHGGAARRGGAPARRCDRHAGEAADRRRPAAGACRTDAALDGAEGRHRADGAR